MFHRVSYATGGAGFLNHQQYELHTVTVPPIYCVRCQGRLVHSTGGPGIEHQVLARCFGL